MNKFLKKGLIFLVIVFIGMQFYTPEKNISETYSTAFFENETQPPAPILASLQNKCYDCHSNNTNYPWYNNIAPVSYWIDDHILDGKKHLNFSEFTKNRIAVQNHKFEEIIEMVEDKEMPLPSYTYLGLHPQANLTDNQRDLIVNWGADQMSYLKANFSEDSLVFKRK